MFVLSSIVNYLMFSTSKATSDIPSEIHGNSALCSSEPPQDVNRKSEYWSASVLWMVLRVSDLKSCS